MTSYKVNDEFLAHLRKDAERSAAREAIYSALSQWTGEEVNEDSDVPVVRNGEKVGQLTTGTVLRGSDVDRVVNASQNPNSSELKSKSAAIRRARDYAFEMLASMEHLSGYDFASISLNNKGLRQDTSDRVIDAIGLQESVYKSANKFVAGADAELEKLEEKIANYPKSSGRPKNTAAHDVATELGRLYAKVTGKRPTYGEGKHGLSGEFTPVVRDVFDALGWEDVGLRGPIEAAIAAITDEDLAHEKTLRTPGLLPVLMSSQKQT